MKTTNVDSKPVTPPTRSQVRPIDDSLPWHKKALSTEASFVDPNKRGPIQHLGAISRGQAIGGGVLILSALTATYNFFFGKGEGSFFSKYVLPVVTGLLGVVGIVKSKPPKNAFLANLIRTGITDFIKKFRGFTEGKNVIKSIKDLFLNAEDAKRNRLINSANWTLQSIWPALLRSLPEGYSESNTLVNSLSEIASEDVNINKIKELIKEHGEDAIYDFVKANPTLLRGILTELAKEKSFQANLDDLISSINNVIEPSGVALDLSYNYESDLINLCFRSTSYYSRPGEREAYNPLFVTSVKPEFIITAMRFVQQALKDQELLRKQIEELHQKSDGKVSKSVLRDFDAMHRVREYSTFVAILMSLGYAAADSLDRTRVGFFVVDPKTGDRKSVSPKLVPLTIYNLFRQGYIPTPNTLGNLWGKQNSEDVIDGREFQFGTGKVKETKVTPCGETQANAHPEVNTVKPAIQTPIEQEYTSLEPKNISEIPFPNSKSENKLQRYLDFFRFDFNNEDSKEVKRLKVVLVSALVKKHVETKKWGKGEDPIDYFIGVMDEIRSRFNVKVISEDIGNVKIEPKGMKYEIPQDLIKLDYFLDAFGIKNEKLNKDDIGKLAEALNLLSNEQADFLMAQLKEKARVKFV